jgi:RsiW-degrading membrane proteinase PrsW (M82 family)
MHCVKCGTYLVEGARFCQNCGLSAKSTQINPQQYAADIITGKLGLERIERFSLSDFFRGVFKKRTAEDIENHLSAGFIKTTPALDASMAIMPSPWLFFRLFIFSFVSYFIFYFAWIAFKNIYTIPGLIILGSFAIPFSVLILFFELNTPRNISLAKTVQVLIMGGAVSMLLSLLLYDIVPFLGALGPPSAGIVEEIGKVITLAILAKSLDKNRYPYILNGLLLGAAVGTGCAAFESAGYALRVGLVNADNMMDIIEIRGLLSPFGHIIWTAIAGAIYWKQRKFHTSTIDTLTDKAFLSVFIAPVLLHMIWDTGFELPLMGKFIILGFIGWVIVISLTQTGLNEIRQIVTERERIVLAKAATKPRPVIKYDFRYLSEVAITKGIEKYIEVLKKGGHGDVCKYVNQSYQRFDDTKPGNIHFVALIISMDAAATLAIPNLDNYQKSALYQRLNKYLSPFIPDPKARSSEINLLSEYVATHNARTARGPAKS